MENKKMEEINISRTILSILEKIRPEIQRITDHYNYDIYGDIHYHRAVYIIPQTFNKPMFTLKSKGGEWSEYEYHNKLDIYIDELKEEPIERIWCPDFDWNDYEFFENLQKVYQDDSYIALLYIYHVKKILSESPLEYCDHLQDLALYIIFDPTIKWG
ncbi:MAG: hypothetical protein QW745_06980 [Thermoplasmata archaeon]